MRSSRWEMFIKIVEKKQMFLNFADFTEKKPALESLFNKVDLSLIITF